MTLRQEYSLRQALSVGLFGVPLYVVEWATDKLLGLYNLEFTSTSVTDLAFVGLPLLGVGTFALAYMRFETEYEKRLLIRRRPLQVIQFVWNWALILVFLLFLMVLSLGEAGLPSGQYHWARQGIMGLGLFGGLCLVKWIYFDWLQRESADEPPPSPGASGPVSPVAIPTGPGRNTNVHSSWNVSV